MPKCHSQDAILLRSGAPAPLMVENMVQRVLDKHLPQTSHQDHPQLHLLRPHLLLLPHQVVSLELILQGKIQILQGKIPQEKIHTIIMEKDTTIITGKDTTIITGKGIPEKTIRTMTARIQERIIKITLQRMERILKVMITEAGPEVIHRMATEGNIPQELAKELAIRPEALAVDNRASIFRIVFLIAWPISILGYLLYLWIRLLGEIAIVLYEKIKESLVKDETFA